VTLGRAEVEHAIKLRALSHAKLKGVAVPADEYNFSERARVHYYPDGRVAVTLEV